jgi:hypothetical protein
LCRSDRAAVRAQLERTLRDGTPFEPEAPEIASPLLEKRMQRLVVDIPREGLPVDADPTRLAQVFQNLLTNAAKYSEPGSQIMLRARRDVEQVIVELTDQGIGTSAELMPRLFDLFVQGDRTLDRSQGGLGIGLTIVKSLCELHGGTISAASAGIGHGSTFTVTLPRVARADSPVPVRAGEHVARAATGETDRARGAHVAARDRSAGGLTARAKDNIGRVRLGDPAQPPSRRRHAVVMGWFALVRPNRGLLHTTRTSHRPRCRSLPQSGPPPTTGEMPLLCLWAPD